MFGGKQIEALSTKKESMILIDRCLCSNSSNVDKTEKKKGYLQFLLNSLLVEFWAFTCVKAVTEKCWETFGRFSEMS